MGRCISVPPVSDEELKKLAERRPEEEKTYSIKLITPMYGGGVVAGVNEQDRPVRVPSVRGNLRFWWRATRGTAFPSLEELKRREAEIWGSTERASPTWVEVDCAPYDQSRNYHENYGFDDRYGPQTYALFPAANRENRHNLVKEGLSFTLRLHYRKEYETDVQCAVWAWVNFGGLGARTRKGCGALYCDELAPRDAQTFGTWLKERLKEYEVSSSPIGDLPHVGRKALFGQKEGGSLVAWSKGLSAIKDFRQKSNLARSPGSGNRPGRSYWPEPDTIRRALNRNAPAHNPDPAKPDGFPRALFGLPIVFHFRDEGAGDPSTEAYPKGKKRMASPVIIKPLGTQDGQFFPVVLFLDGTRPREIELKGSSGSFGTSQIINPKFSTYNNSPMKGRSNNGDALEAFRAYLKERDYKEVSL